MSHDKNICLRPHYYALCAGGFAEGCLWGLVFWIKPYVAVPCVLVWLTSARRTIGSRKLVAFDAASVLLGGLSVGLAGCIWLVISGGWTDFWDIMLVWNRQYVRHDMGRELGWLYRLGPLIRLSPWIWLHLAAIPCAVLALVRARSSRRSLLAACYLGWLIQALFLQHVYDYIFVPTILLAIVVLGQQIAGLPATSRAITLLLLACAVTGAAPLSFDRLLVWQECVRGPASAALRDRLSLLRRMSWKELEEVHHFLKSRHLSDGELTCLSMRTIPLYEKLNVRPSTRYVLLGNIWEIFTSQRQRISQDLGSSRQRWLVCDVTTTRWKTANDPGRDKTRDQIGEVSFPREGLVFQSGRYAVYGVNASRMAQWMAEYLE